MSASTAEHIVHWCQNYAADVYYEALAVLLAERAPA